MINKWFKFWFIIVVGFILMQCENPTEPVNNMPQNGKNLELLNPKGGEIFSVDQKVTISFKVNADSILGTVPKISINGGKNWYDIVQQINSGSQGGGQLHNYEWTIGQESQTVPYSGTMSECLMRIANYNDKTEYDQIAIFFTINAK